MPSLTPSQSSSSTPGGRWQAILSLPFQPSIYRMVGLVYIPILFPLTALLVWVGTRVDRALGLSPWPLPPWNWLGCAVAEALGLLWVGWCYSYLVHDAGGSPAPFLGRTQKLVKDGPYQLMRNPSVWGKLAGVMGVGLAVQTPGFLLLVCPLLVAGSIFEKAWRQEPVLHQLWPEEYAEYCRVVPRFFPRPSSVWKVLTGRSVYEDSRAR